MSEPSSPDLDMEPVAEPRSRVTRRLLLRSASGAMALGAAAVAGIRLARADDTKTFPKDDEDDDAIEGDEGIALLQAYMEGNVRPAVITNPRWTFTLSQVGNYAVYVPPRWSWTEYTDPTPADFSDGFTTSTHIVSPDGDARFIVYDVGLVPGVVTMPQFLEATLEQLAEGEPIDVIVSETWSLLAPDDAAFVAARIAGNIVTMEMFGSVFVSPGLTNSSYGGTIQIGAAAAFDQLTTDYFFPMFSNYQRFSGGGSSDPTPTPTPTT